MSEKKFSKGEKAIYKDSKVEILESDELESYILGEGYQIWVWNKDLTPIPTHASDWQKEAEDWEQWSWFISLVENSISDAKLEKYPNEKHIAMLKGLIDKIKTPSHTAHLSQLQGEIDVCAKIIEDTVPDMNPDCRMALLSLRTITQTQPQDKK